VSNLVRKFGSWKHKLNFPTEEDKRKHLEYKESKKPGNNRRTIMERASNNESRRESVLHHKNSIRLTNFMPFKQQKSLDSLNLCLKAKLEEIEEKEMFLLKAQLKKNEIERGLIQAKISRAQMDREMKDIQTEMQKLVCAQLAGNEENI